MDKTPFLVVGSGRSGTGWLADLLRSHPEISCVSEPTGRNYSGRLNHHHVYWPDDDIWICPRETRQRPDGGPPGTYTSLVDYFEDKIWTLPSSIVGAKVLNRHFVLYAAMEELVQRTRPLVRAIRLWRNPLRRALSRYWAGHLRNWTARNAAACKKRYPVALRPYLFYREAHTQHEHWRRVTRKLRGLQTLKVTYGDLIRDTQGTLAKIQKFLGAPVQELTSDHCRLMPGDIRDWVVNWEQVKEELPARWQHLLEDDLT